MIRFILFLVILIFAVVLGLYIQTDPGYILLSYGHWSIEMPIWAGLVSVFLIYFIIHWILKILHIGGNVSGKMRIWSNRRQLRSAHHRTNQGLIDLAEGHWRRAEKNLVKGAENSDTPLINYLAAAKAAQEQDAYERRENHLRRAHKANPDAKVAIELTQAQLQIDHKQLEQALATLCHIRELAPHHPYVLKLLKSIYFKLNDWKRLAELLPEIRKAKIIDQQALGELEKIIYENLLQKSAQKTDHFIKNHINDIWESIPKALKSDPDILFIYVNHLMKTDKNELAEKLVRDFLKKNWDCQLVILYALIPNVDRKKQLVIAENWLKSHKQDAELFLTLGRLCTANQLWGKARTYFDNSITVKPTTDAYTELGQLYEQLNEPPMALDCYRKAIAV